MCEYCKENKSLVDNRFTDTSLFVSKKYKNIYWRFYNIPEEGKCCVSYAEINFCPMCGEKL